MKVALIVKPHVLEIVEREISAPSTDEIQVLVDLVGVCATDVHIYEGEFPKAKMPLIIGHEFTGIVGEVGSAVKNIKPGSRVAIDPAISCEICLQCLRGRRNLCTNRQAYGINLPGGMAERVNVRATNCYVFSEKVSASAAVLTEPLACVLHAFERLGKVEGLSCLVLGAGAIGLLSTQVALEKGVASVDQIDLREERLSSAKKVGAREVASKLNDLTQDKWDVVVDATGVVLAIKEGIDALARGGTLLQIGVTNPSHEISISPYKIFLDELRIIGSLTTEGNFPEAVRLLESGRIIHQVITGQPLELSDLSDSLRNSQEARHPKVVVLPG